MTNQATKQIIQSGIDGIADMISYSQEVPGDELHNRLYNEDYFIIGTHKATMFLERYGSFDAIAEVQDYERDNFGEVTTDLSDPEKVANMLAYIKGEAALNACDSFDSDNTYTVEDLSALKKELEAQL